MDRFDVIIVGTGAGSGTLARHLAPSGKRILLLERGDWLAREPQNWSAAEVFIDNRYVSPDTWATSCSSGSGQRRAVEQPARRS
jgi:choline dehydrogenase-like flavoprotein